MSPGVGLRGNGSYTYRIVHVRIISPWVISLTSALNRGWAYSMYSELIPITIDACKRIQELRAGGGWAYNTSWAYNTYYTVHIRTENASLVLRLYVCARTQTGQSKTVTVHFLIGLSTSKQVI